MVAYAENTTKLKVKKKKKVLLTILSPPLPRPPCPHSSRELEFILSSASCQQFLILVGF